MVERPSPESTPAGKTPQPPAEKTAPVPHLPDSELDAVAGGKGGAAGSRPTNDIDPGVKIAIDL